MRKTTVATIALTLAMAWAPSRIHSRPAAARIADKQVEEAMKQVDDGLDRFVDKMDPQLRRSVIKNERGEVDVKAFLDDLRKSSDTMKGRFEPPRYSANTEVLAFLKQARRLDDAVARNPGRSGADPAWALVKPGLGKLAGAYGIDFASDPAGWTAAVRASDDDVKAVLKRLEKNAEGLRKELEKDMKKDKSLDATARTSAIAPAIGLASTAKQAASSFSDGQDVSPLVGKLLGSGHEVESVIAGRKLAAPATTMWNGVSDDLGKIAKAYGVTPAAVKD
jgi:hypothetical protein